MSPDFRIGEAHLYPAEPAGSTRTTEAISGKGMWGGLIYYLLIVIISLREVQTQVQEPF